MADPLGSLSKNEKIGLAAGAAGLLGFTIYRYQKQKSSDAATAAADAAAQAPGTGAGTADQVDPATGFPYGSAEDSAALTAQSGYISPIGGLGSSGVSYNYGGQGAYPQGFTNNAQWSQAAEDYLVNTAGADANTVGNALGKYITGQTVTSDQQSIINQAIAFEGYPPVGGPDGYPPSIRTAAPTSTVPPPTTGGGTVYAGNPPSGLKLLNNGRTAVRIGWNATPNATSYTVNLVGHGPSNTNKTWENIGTLKPNTSYTVQVWANPTKSGGPHATLTFKTTR